MKPPWILKKQISVFLKVKARVKLEAFWSLLADKWSFTAFRTSSAYGWRTGTSMFFGCYWCWLWSQGLKNLFKKSSIVNNLLIHILYYCKCLINCKQLALVDWYLIGSCLYFAYWFLTTSRFFVGNHHREYCSARRTCSTINCLDYRANIHDISIQKLSVGRQAQGNQMVFHQYCSILNQDSLTISECDDMR